MIWGAIICAALFYLWQIVRWWNLPKVAEERTEKVETRQENRTTRLKNWLNFRLRRRGKEPLP